MRKLKVDLQELEWAIEDASPEVTHYLDTETGEVLMVTYEMRRELERIFEEMYGDGDEPRIPFEDALQQRNLPEWMQEALRDADRVEEGFGTRYIEVPEADSGEGYRDMEDFIDTVQDRRLQNHLWGAIRGRGAFRRFKDVLLNHPAEQERWFAFRDARLRQRVIEWLEEEEIEPILE